MASPLCNIAYVDCFSGISGDMFLAALIETGVPHEYLQEQLSLLNIQGLSINLTKSTKQNGIKALRLTITSAEKTSPHRTWHDIRRLIEDSQLSMHVKQRSLDIFKILAEAEAKVHDRPVEDIHFHEVGAIDSIADIVGAAIGLEYLRIEKLYSSALPMPSGWVRCQHGKIPLPAPAVCELLKDTPVYGVELKQELVTPTGAAILKGSLAEFGPMPAMQMDHIGYGAGKMKRTDGCPNMLRLVIGKQQTVSECQEVIVIESNLDDWSPESFPYLSEKILALGALDITITSVQMKKGRPGFTVQIIAPPEKSLELKNCLLSETTAIGLRFRYENRMTLSRKLGTVASKIGRLRVKMVETPVGPCLYPEYEDCKAKAKELRLPIKEVYKAASSCSPEDFIPDSTE